MPISYVVEVEEKDGRRLKETWKLNAQTHAPDGQPAVRVWDDRTGNLVGEIYCKNDLVSRVDGPAIQYRHSVDGHVIGEEWMVDEKRHRTGDKPALWEMDYDTGIIHRELYWEDGVEHRGNGMPAVIIRNNLTGEVELLEYHIHGRLIQKISPPDGCRLPDPGPLKALEP